MNSTERLRIIGRMGGIARNKTHGNPGTMDGRRLGGLNSIQTHRRLKTGFVVAKKFRRPPKSAPLAEFLGLLIGDGHLSKYQLLITTNSETDIQHARFAQQQIKKLFDVNSTLKVRKERRTVTVVASSTLLVFWLSALGMPVGDKLTNDLSIPSWVYARRNWLSAFIRGLFDTDGCIYADRHIIKGRRYENPGWTITSYSATLRSDIVRLLSQWGYKPTSRVTQKSVYMRREADIRRYFQEIGSHNEKHLARYRQICGRVPKRS